MVLINKNLLYAKLVLFFWSSAKNSLLYYMPIQLKAIGLSVAEAGIIYTILPILSFVVPPAVGTIGDKLGNYKQTTLISVVCLTAITLILSELPNKKKKSVDFGVAFWSYLLLRIIFETFYTAVRIMNKSTIVTVAKEDGYGKQRVWYAVASIIFNPLSGFLMTIFTKKDGVVNYKPSFYLFTALMVPLFIFVCFVEIKVKKRKKEEQKPIKQFLKSGRVWFFYIVVVIVGIIISIRQPYFVLFFEDLKGPPYLLGVLKALSALINIPLVYFSSAMVKKIGHVYMYILVYSSWVLKFIFFALIYDPWLFIPVFALVPFSENFVSCANAEYALSLSPPGYLATFIGIAGNANQGVGKIIGRLLGGLLWSLIGPRGMYEVFAGISFTAAVAVTSLYLLYKPFQKTTPVSDDFPVSADAEVSPVDETTALLNEEIVQNHTEANGNGR